MKTLGSVILIAFLISFLIGSAIKLTTISQQAPKPLQNTEVLGEVFTDNLKHEIVSISHYRVSKQNNFVYVYEIFYKDGDKIKYKFLGDKANIVINLTKQECNSITNDTVCVNNFADIQKKR